MACLDPLSASFVPLEALYAEDDDGGDGGRKFKVPRANNYALDNIYKCRQFLRDDDPDYVPSAKITESLKGRRLNLSQTRPNSRYVSPIDTMVQNVDSGPLVVLRRCVALRKQATVWIRRADGIRGKLKGFVKVFDKHLNIVLTDASEEYVATEYVSVPGDWRSRSDWKRKRTPEPKPRPRLEQRTLSRLPSFEEKVTAFFQAYNPALSGTASAIVAKFKDGAAQREIWPFLQKRYGVTERFEMFYRRYNPQKISNVPEILKKYGGREVELEQYLQKKYSVRSRVWKVLGDYSDAHEERVAFDSLLHEHFGREDELIDTIVNGKRVSSSASKSRSNNRGRRRDRSGPKLVPKRVAHTRRLRQVLVRGDCVAMVALAG